VRSFRFALAVEEIHHGLYEKALESVKGGGDLPRMPIYVCPVCGNTFEGETPDKCPVCNVPKEKFFEVK
jgi:rubrerythrin